MEESDKQSYAEEFAIIDNFLFGKYGKSKCNLRDQGKTRGCNTNAVVTS